MNTYRFALIMLTSWACWAALPGRVGAEPLSSVEITALRHPAAWPYSDFLAGLDEFEEEQALAPQARLEFRLRPDRADVVLGNITVKLETDARDYTLELDDGKFSLPRLHPDEQAHAQIALNQQRQDYTFHMPRAEVRTAGLPDDTLRLGDLRLACKVNMAIFKESIGIFKSLGLAMLARRTDWCRVEKNGGQSADAPFEYRVMTMEAGSRHERRTFDRPARQVKLPLEQADWPDSTLIRLEP
jgi:hypothetical protein